jgi:hypothetical protein
MANRNLVLVRLENGRTARVGAGFAESHDLELVGDTEDSAKPKPTRSRRQRTAKKAAAAPPKTSPAAAEDSTTTGTEGSASASSEEENQ